MKIINGKDIVSASISKLKEEYKKAIIKKGRAAQFTMIVVGNNEASKSYIKSKEKLCSEIGIETNTIILNENISEIEVENLIKNLNKDKNVDAILLQLPLPTHLNSVKLIEFIDPKKDVDALTSTNIGKLVLGIPQYIPCTAKAVIKILDYLNINVEGLDVIIIGRSNIVGKPLANLLINKRATVQVCNAKTKNLKEKIKKSDIVISATGVKYLISSSDVKENSVLIDVGITRENNKLYGDFNLIDIEKENKVKYITKVPSGIGPVTVLSLVENIVEIFKGE